MRAVWIGVRLVTAGAIAAAVIAQLQRTISLTVQEGGPVAHVAVNFISFFTIDSNLIGAVAAVLGAIVLARRRGVASDPRWFLLLRICAVTYLTTTLLVYNVLLRGIPLPQGQTVPWSNEVLHVVAPLLVLLDWLFAPGRRAVGWRALWVVVAFPLAWVAYTLIRGPLVGWYPYPFLDPANFGGSYGPVAGYVVGIAALIIGVAALAVLLARRWRARG